MPGDQDVPIPPSFDLDALNKRMDDFSKELEARSKAQRKEFYDALFKAAEENVARSTQEMKKSLQESRKKLYEAQQKQNEAISEKGRNSNANKHTGERVDIQKIEPIPEASAVATPAKPVPELRSPPENFQPSSPKQVCSKQEVTEKINESNLFARMKAVDKFLKERLKSAPQQKINLSKPYAPRVLIKEDKWYVQERGTAVELTASQKRNMQRRFGRAKRTLEALDMGLVKPEELIRTPEQLRRTVERLSVKPIIPVKKQNKQPEVVRHRPSAFAKKKGNIREFVPGKLQWQPKQVKSQNTTSEVVPKSQLKEPKLVLTEPIHVAPTVRPFIFCNIIGQFGIFECLVIDRGADNNLPNLIYFSILWPASWPIHYYLPSLLPRLGGYT